ncbi:hypothetical protein GWO43_08720 [candidate division KSB1 bacterium]|nr:hypothetical protein [candidate division KSB1 bacterium]NIR72457.1 hypothetical protein [candidate division KSB1 bacterium]NIS24043.1 hypothetical protein [candidate division KSB1 bacterium]NIT70962.1 hypothetical protein [candidate division KSB1 bacterium]NIU27373.1 hypothetical protein [candidate division KSB1 bacterium]
MKKYDSIFEGLLHRINQLRVKEKKLSLAEGAISFLLIFAGVFLIVVAVEAIYWLGSAGRYALAGTLLLVGVFALTYFILRPLYSLYFRKDDPDDVHLALKIGDTFKHIRDRMADAMQVFQKHKQNPEGYSLELADASLSEIDDELKEADFASVADVSKLKNRCKVFLGSAFAVVVIYLIFSSNFSAASYRLLHPSKDFKHEVGLSFKVTPGDAEVVKGENVSIQTQVEGKEVSQIQLAVKNTAAQEFERFVLNANQAGQFSYTLENVRDNLEYFMEADAHKSRQFSINVIELPYLRNLQVKLDYPSYSKLGSQFLDENVGDFSALKGTVVEVRAQTNKPLQEAKIVFGDDSETPLKISGKELIGKFTLSNSGSYHFSLTDKKELANANPIEYRMTVLEDEFPLVELTFPGQDVDLGEDMLLPLTVEAQDDFGFSKARIGYQIFEGGRHEKGLQFLSLALPKEVSDKLLINHTWDLSELGIFPEDVVMYYAEVFDNDRVSGPKSSKSQTYRVRFPSLNEMYDEVARGHEQTFESMEDVFEESKALRDNLKEIVQEMKRDPELNWEEKQKVQESLQAQDKMRQELESIQENLDQMINRMEQNDLLSPETLEKYRELQKLMEEMITPEMKEALRELQKSLQELDPQKMKEALEKFSASQEEFLQSMERTLNLLKKLQIEQKLDEAVRRAQDLLRRQEELNKQMSESANKQDGNKYAREEKGIQRDTGDLSESLDDLQNKMSEFPQMPNKRIESAQNLTDPQLQSQLQKAVQQMQSGDMQGAQSSTQQISQNMQELLETLQTAKQEMTDAQKQKIMQALSRSSHDLLNLSKQQEGLMQSTQGMDRNSPGMNDAADKQQNLLSGLSRVSNDLLELSQQTFFVTPEIGKALGKSMSGMKGSLKELEARNSAKSVGNQGQAMAGLNEAVAELRNSMQQMSGASSAIGFQEMMQRLMGASQKQQGINQRTQNLGEQPGGLTMEQQAALSRLAAEQEAVRKSLEQLAREMGNRSEILGDLGKVSEDMEKVVKELQNQNVNRNTIQRQKRILSRLLDAQRSMHNRDFSRKRRAETGKEYQTLSPESLPSELLTRKDKLKNELLRAMKEGYSKDYRELIRKYFEALYEQQSEEAMNN